MAEWTNPKYAALVDAYRTANDSARMWRRGNPWRLRPDRWIPGITMMTDPAAGKVYCVTAGQRADDAD